VADEDEYVCWAPVRSLLPNGNRWLCCIAESTRVDRLEMRLDFDICRGVYDVLALLKPILPTHKPVADVF
jgi:hypothetical protein